MNKEMIAIAAAFIASLTSLFTTGLNLWFSSQRDFELEKQRWVCAREQDARRSLELALADFARQLSGEAIRISWLAWFAQVETPAAVKKELAAYEVDIRALRPKLVGAATVVAAQDLAVYDRVATLPTTLRELDNRLAMAVRAWMARGTDREEIKSIHDSVLKLITDLPSKLASATGPQSSKCPR